MFAIRPAAHVLLPAPQGGREGGREALSVLSVLCAFFSSLSISLHLPVLASFLHSILQSFPFISSSCLSFTEAYSMSSSFNPSDLPTIVFLSFFLVSFLPFLIPPSLLCIHFFQSIFPSFLFHLCFIPSCFPPFFLIFSQSFSLPCFSLFYLVFCHFPFHFSPQCFPYVPPTSLSKSFISSI